MDARIPFIAEIDWARKSVPEKLDVLKDAINQLHASQVITDNELAAKISKLKSDMQQEIQKVAEMVEAHHNQRPQALS
jgi:D-ribose pyranose/furanose isomerase RbsD